MEQLQAHRTALDRVTGQVPKVIDPATHAVLDYATAGAFLTYAWYLWNRHRRAAALALANGVSVLTVSMLTDYPGGVFPTFSFETHGMLDVMQAGMSAAGPAMLGFAGDPEAQGFHMQAAVEAGVVAATDWHAA